MFTFISPHIFKPILFSIRKRLYISDIVYTLFQILYNPYMKIFIIGYWIVYAYGLKELCNSGVRDWDFGQGQVSKEKFINWFDEPLGEEGIGSFERKNWRRARMVVERREGGRETPTRMGRRGSSETPSLYPIPLYIYAIAEPIATAKGVL